ncbi:MAG: transposase domain-containing protein [Ruminococcus sp.]
MSIIETAKRNELNVYGYLFYLLTVLPKWGENPSDEQLKSVIPRSMALPEYCRKIYTVVQ